MIYEPELKRQIRSLLSDDFLLKSEVDGYSVCNGQPVRIDFLAYPKKHLLPELFPPIYFGIECKAIHNKPKSNKHIAKLADTIWQAITYRQSLFHIQGRDISPDMVFVFTNHFDIQDETFKIFFQLALRANVGFFEYHPDSTWNLWSMCFVQHQSSFFRKLRNGNFVRNQTNIGLPVYVGNTSQKRNIEQQANAYYEWHFNEPLPF